MRVVRQLVGVFCLLPICGCCVLHIGFYAIPGWQTEAVSFLWMCAIGPAAFGLGVLREQGHPRVKRWSLWRRWAVNLLTYVLIGYAVLYFIGLFLGAGDRMHFLDPNWMERLGILTHAIFSYARMGLGF